MKHDKVCAHVYYSICDTFGIETADILYTRARAHTHTQTSMSTLIKMLKCYGIKGTHRQRSHGK